MWDVYVLRLKYSDRHIGESWRLFVGGSKQGAKYAELLNVLCEAQTGAKDG